MACQSGREPSARPSSGLRSSWVAGGSSRSGPHRINSGTLSYLPRGGYPRHTRSLLSVCNPPSSSLLSLRLRLRCVVHGRSNVDDGMTDRGRVRVADTGRVIGRPPGGRPPSRGHEGRLVSQTQRALERSALRGRRQLQADNVSPAPPRISRGEYAVFALWAVVLHRPNYFCAIFSYDKFFAMRHPLFSKRDLNVWNFILFSAWRAPCGKRQTSS